MKPVSVPELTLSPHMKLIQTLHGPLFVLATDTTVGRSLIEYGEWSAREIELLRQALRPGDRVIDIGANIGTHTISLAKIVGPQGSVLAFEPQPLIFQLLAANVLINRAANTELVLGACGAISGTVALAGIDYTRDGQYSALSLADLQRLSHETSAAIQTVNTFVLDDMYGADRLRLIKIDVEGMEKEVLRGAERLIERHRPTLYIENEWPETSEELLRTLASLDYRSFWHMIPLYNPDNYYGNPCNRFGHASIVNNLCIPSEMSFDAYNLQPVVDPSEHPRRSVTKKAVALNEKAAAVLSSRAASLQAAGQHGEAIALYGRALVLDPKCVAALVQLASALEALGRLEEALASYDNALAIEAENKEAIRGRVRALKQLRP